ncbi:glycoside hydrolase family 71 protein [Pholiota molesta]|nr:glycoside hydrolase family 71 protein [Pholiota molesta]
MILSRMHSRFSLIIALWLTCQSSSILRAHANIVPRSNAPKLVVAHVIVGNTYPYTKENWKRDIALAASKGIDAFALNIGRDDWQPARVSDAYSAAIGTDFKMFFSFDMASFPCGGEGDGNLLRQLIKGYNGHPNQLVYKDKNFVSTFGGQFCRFGAGSLDDGWYNIMKKDMPPVHFVPAFFINPSELQNMRSIDGAYSWDSAWPMGKYDINSSTDVEYQKYLKGRTYMAGVSPWFFTHYSQATYNKNMIYRPDSWLYASRWELLKQNRNSIDLAQIITWNDYGESHYIGPIEGPSRNPRWLDLAQYYIAAYKTGNYPPIHKDRVFLWGRLYPKNANSGDPVGKPANYEWTEDTLWADVLLSKPAHFEMTCGGSKYSGNLPAGANKVKMPLKDDCSVSSSVTRDGKKTVDFTPPGFRFSKNPPSYNFNAFVAASPG